MTTNWIIEDKGNGKHLGYGGEQDSQIAVANKVPYGRAKESIVVEEPLTATEIAIQAGLDQHKLFKTPTFIKTSEGLLETGEYAVGRVDTQTVFRTGFSSQYTIKDALQSAQDLDKLTGGRPIFVSGGSLKGGRVNYFIADLDSSQDILPNDTVKSQLVFLNSHDGSHALRVSVAPFRLACLNQLNVAIYGSKQRFSMVHRASIGQFETLGQGFFDQVDEQFHTFGDTCKQLTQMTMNTGDISEFIMDLFALDPYKVDIEEKEGGWTGGQHRKYDALYDAIVNGSGIKSIEGVSNTGWAVFNGVTEWADHIVRPRTKHEEDKPEARLYNALAGGTQTFKQKAFDKLVAMSGAS